ncbi:hypothetical protein CJ030_MR2G010232 [Morella rubra]|uniref:DUF1279 domain-containing protein n=1 Tax=Morella rubra TaxID=262757 RepID=A0A6A1WBK7_9ROSI|nr:hypothetical protein CJ030_MR2G010232 [Morella rubra]
MATGLPALSSAYAASLLNNGRLRSYCLASIPQSKSNLKSFRVTALKEKTEENKSTASSPPSSTASAEEITKKYGLEAALWKETAWTKAIVNSSNYLSSSGPANCRKTWGVSPNGAVGADLGGSRTYSKALVYTKTVEIFSSKEEGTEGVEENKSKGNQAKELLAKYGGAYLATSITLSLISFLLCYALISAGIDVQALLQRVGISTNETGEKVGTFALAYAAHKAASPIRFPPTVALTPIVASWIGKKVEKEK